MSRKPRFECLRVVDRGYPIAVCKDTKAGRIHWVRRQGQTLLEWDRLDKPVENGLLRSCARLALDTHQEELIESIGKPCRKCHEPFRPKRNAKTCPKCISEIGERASRMARGGAVG